MFNLFIWQILCVLFPIMLITWRGSFIFVNIKQQSLKPKGEFCKFSGPHQWISAASSGIYSIREMHKDTKRLLQKEVRITELSNNFLTYFAEYICEV